MWLEACRLYTPRCAEANAAVGSTTHDSNSHTVLGCAGQAVSHWETECVISLQTFHPPSYEHGLTQKTLCGSWQPSFWLQAVVGEHGCKYASFEFEFISKSNQCLLSGLPGTFYKMNKVHFSYTSVILGWIHTVPSVIALNCVKDAILAVQCQVLPINSALN